MLVISKVEISNILPAAFNPRLIDAGFIIISACREGYIDAEEYQKNKAQIEDLKASIQLSKYASVCVWAEYEKSGEPDRHRESEPSFIVFNTKSPKYKERSIRQESSLELKQLGKTWCKQFGQKAYFYKEEGSSKEAYLVDDMGKVLQSFDEYRPLQAADLYFESRNTMPKDTSGFTYVKDALWLARPDWGTCGRVMRYGEIFID